MNFHESYNFITNTSLKINFITTAMSEINLVLDRKPPQLQKNLRFSRKNNLTFLIGWISQLNKRRGC